MFQLDQIKTVVHLVGTKRFARPLSKAIVIALSFAAIASSTIAVEIDRNLGAEPTKKTAVDTELGSDAISDIDDFDQSTNTLKRVNHLGGEIREIEPAGNLVWILRGPRLTAVDFSDPSVPQVLNPGLFAEGLTDISADGSRGVALGESCPCVLDLSDPKSPQISARFELPAEVGQILVKNDYLYAMEDGNAIRVVDLRDAAQPKVLARTEISAGGQLVSLESRLLVLNHSTSIVIDLVNPEVPMEIALVESPIDPSELRFLAARTVGAEDLVYYVSANESVVLDIRQANAPRTLEPAPRPFNLGSSGVPRSLVVPLDGNNISDHLERGRPA